MESRLVKINRLKSIIAPLNFHLIEVGLSPISFEVVDDEFVVNCNYSSQMSILLLYVELCGFICFASECSVRVSLL